MKKLVKATAALMLMTAVVFVAGCKPEEEPNNGGGDVLNDSVVKVTTYTPQDIKATTAVCGGDVIAPQGLTLTQLGVCWSESLNPTADGPHLSTTNWSEPYVCTITGLEPGTKYHVRAYALRGLEYYYGDDKSFTTEQNGGGGNTEEFIIGVSSNPSEGGTVNGGGSYQQGESCTVTATANDGYVFYYWSEDNEWVSSDATYTFTVDRDRSIVAHFAISSGDGHAYVDLGLPSGTLWATCNLGADTPEGYGDYFAWGETQPKTTYNWGTYKYCNGDYFQLTKYCSKSSYGYNGFADNLTTLEPSDDAATANWGNGWCMPTKEQWQELYQNTTHTWTTQNGVNGRLFTANNGTSLFLPAAGYRWDYELNLVGSDGGYWSSSLNTGYPHLAWGFLFGYGYYHMGDYGSPRNEGHSVRAVRSSSQK